VLIFVELRNQGDKSKKRRLDCISQRNALSLAQGKVAQSQDHVDALKFGQIKSGSKKNQVCKLNLILLCFIYLLSIGHRTIKRDATW
jgi:hypothetical protein